MRIKIFIHEEYTSSSPIIIAIQGSSSDSIGEWHAHLSDELQNLGIGLVMLDKQGISPNTKNISEYLQTNSLAKRYDDYLLCLKQLPSLAPEWQGKMIFWGESEGSLLAARLASEQKNNTLAILLFASSGGIPFQEEIKWTLGHHLQSHGASPSEVMEYFHFIDQQISDMINEPTADKEFLGKTYKWWESFFSQSKNIYLLENLSLPICLVHGTMDLDVPVHSSDMIAHSLKERNLLTYFRLEDCGHDLSPLAYSQALDWLTTVLFDQNDIPLFICDALAPQSNSTTLVAHSQDWKTDLDQYIFQRGRVEMSGGGRVEKDNEDNPRYVMDGEVKVTHETESGLNLEVRANAAASIDSQGNTKTEASVRAGLGRDF